MISCSITIQITCAALSFDGSFLFWSLLYFGRLIETNKKSCALIVTRRKYIIDNVTEWKSSRVFCFSRILYKMNYKIFSQKIFTPHRPLSVFHSSRYTTESLARFLRFVHSFHRHKCVIRWSEQKNNTKSVICMNKFKNRLNFFQFLYFRFFEPAKKTLFTV